MLINTLLDAICVYGANGKAIHAFDGFVFESATAEPRGRC